MTSNTAEMYENFAIMEARGVSPTYELLASKIADDADFLAMISRLPQVKRQPNLVFGAARHLGAPTDSFESFRTWAVDNWPDIEALALTKSTQTNEAARTAVLLPVLGLLTGPLSLIEVGASAGLCLYPDQYSYSYDGNSFLHPPEGPSKVLLECTTTGQPPIPDQLPVVIGRTGVDLNPLDVTSPTDMSWLDSLIWPEHHQRRRRLRSAADIARRDPPDLIRGDLNAVVADLVESAASDTTVVVFHTAVLNYLDDNERRTFEHTVRSLPCHWISNEGPRVLPHITRTASIPREEIGGRFVLSLDGTPLALTAPHGQSVDWLR